MQKQILLQPSLTFQHHQYCKVEWISTFHHWKFPTLWTPNTHTHCLWQHHPLTFLLSWVILYKSLLHFFLLTHKCFSCVCIQSFLTLFCLSSFTWSLHLVLHLFKSCLFDIFIFHALKGILLLFMHDTCSYQCILNFTSFLIVIIPSCPDWILMLILLQNLNQELSLTTTNYPDLNKMKSIFRESFCVSWKTWGFHSNENSCCILLGCDAVYDMVCYQCFGGPCCLHLQHVEVNRGSGGKLWTLLTLILGHSCSSYFLPSTHWIGGWEGPRANVHMMVAIHYEKD